MYGAAIAFFLLIFLRTGTAETGNSTNETEPIQIVHRSADSGVIIAGNTTARISVVDGKLNDSANNVAIESRSSAIGSNNTKRQDNDTFRPSPLLETYYEFNKFPVKPAQPEAKTIPNYLNSDSEARHSVGRSDTTESGLSAYRTTGYVHTNEPHPGDTPWVSRVKFPSAPTCCQGASPYYAPDNNPPVISSDYHRGGSSISTGRGYGPPPSAPSSHEFDFNKLVEVPKRYQYEAPNQYHLVGHELNLMERPSYDVQPKPPGLNPWKKILKLLATFIPIGLLISALTPTVITITNITDTDPLEAQRYRGPKESRRKLENHLLSSLEYFDELNENGCEFRVFCELLVTANRLPDAERHVKTLLDNFAQRELNYKTRANEIKRIFEAVKSEDCQPVPCEYINNPT